MKQKTVLHNLLLSLGAILCSLLIAAGVMLLVGYDPLEAYSALIEGAFGSKNAFANTLSKSIPLRLPDLQWHSQIKAGFLISVEKDNYTQEQWQVR